MRSPKYLPLPYPVAAKDRPELVNTPIPLTVHDSSASLPAGGETFLRELFEPLGYAVTAEPLPLDEEFPDWGDSRYLSVTLGHTIRLSDLLSHLYVLIPVMDEDKHYWFGDDEVDKLLRHGEGWLKTHPSKEQITQRYFKRMPKLAEVARSQLMEGEDPDADAETAAQGWQKLAAKKPVDLNQQRMAAVVAVLKSHDAKRVIDLGCGEGSLLKVLLEDRFFERLMGVDVSFRALERAKKRLRVEQIPMHQQERIQLMQGSLIYRDERLMGYDAAAVIEVIEHIDLNRIRAFERVLFQFVQPPVVVITTPNAEFNVLFPTLEKGHFRHQDHRFEWTRQEFQDWAEDVCQWFGYRVEFQGIRLRCARGGHAESDGRIYEAGTRQMKLTIPELSLVVLIGASGSGKSTFARRHFAQTEILSSDHFRGVVSDDETDQSATKDAFEVLHYILEKRLKAGRLTVIDATNVQREARRSLLKLAKKYHFFSAAIALNLPAACCHERNQQRPDRQFGPHVVNNQTRALKRSLKGLKSEGFRYIYKLNSLEEINAVEIERQPLWNNRKQDHGPFDIIGDVHGCCDEVEQLLEKLGYQAQAATASPDSFWHFPTYVHPQGRKALFLGDLVDRGPRILDALKLVHNMISAGSGLCIMGNHEHKLLRKLNGKNVKVTYGLAETLAEIEALVEAERDTQEIQAFIKSLISHYVLDDGKLVVAHAGLREELQGRGSGYVRSFALYGETTGETDEFGLPIRHNWATDYRGQAMVVHGHTPVAAAEWFNNTIDIDTGCVYGLRLTALRYPEKELVSVNAAKVYREPSRPIEPVAIANKAGIKGSLTAQQVHDDVLDIADVLGKRVVETRLYKKITIREENAIAALEVISRFAVNPKWLIYLPPTMSPVSTSKRPGLLEHSAEAFDYYRQQGVSTVICEEKHMGSRVIVIICRDQAVVKQRFAIENEGIGICYTRTGRRFFDDTSTETAFLNRIEQALSAANFWENFSTDWVCLDCELLPWSAKAQGLLKQQYAPVGVAAQQGLSAAVSALKKAEETTDSHSEVSDLLSRYQQRAELAGQYVDAYRRYCWPVNTLSDLKLAPFHILATEGKVHADQTHEWHLQQIAQIAGTDPDLLLATRHQLVDVDSETSCAEGDRWWEVLTAAGGEGMVVKPMDFIHRGQKGFTQPAVKCRGAEYLRIIYGPEYSLPENLNRLKSRGLNRKRALALREFSLGIESLERFANKAPLREVHECVFGILALESEPVDPRL